MKWSAAPDSTLARETWDPARPWSARWYAFVWLVWLVWLFGPVIFGAGSDYRHWLWPTLASAPVCAALYVIAHFVPRRHIAWFSLAVAALAFAVTPWNPFAETYLIYACALAADWSNLRRSAALVLALLLAYSAEWHLLGFPWQYLANVWLLCMIVAGMSWYACIQGERRAELRLSMDEVRRLAASAERERIGRDLHDLLGHTLSMVALKSELAGRLVERDPAAARREIADVEHVARDALAQVRSAVTGIRAAALASELASARLLLESAGVRLDYWRDPAELPAAVETCLALVLREAVTNVQRHAHANRVEVTVITGVARVVMRIRDDGRGGVDGFGNGLAGMQERVAACGGELVIESPHRRGTGIEVSLPIPAVAIPAGSGVRMVGDAPALHLAHGAGGRA